MLLRRSSLVGGVWEGGGVVWGVSTTTATERVGPNLVLSLWMRFQELQHVYISKRLFTDVHTFYSDVGVNMNAHEYTYMYH